MTKNNNVFETKKLDNDFDLFTLSCILVGVFLVIGFITYISLDVYLDFYEEQQKIIKLIELDDDCTMLLAKYLSFSTNYLAVSIGYFNQTFLGHLFSDQILQVIEERADEIGCTNYFGDGPNSVVELFKK